MVRRHGQDARNLHLLQGRQPGPDVILAFGYLSTALSGWGWAPCGVT